MATDGTKSLTNLTGFSARMMLRAVYADASPVLSLASGSGLTVDGPNGTVTVLITAAQTAALPAGTYVYDIELVAPDTVTVTKLARGKVIVLAEVTR